MPSPSVRRVGRTAREAAPEPLAVRVSRDIYDAVRDAEPLDAPSCFGFPASVRRRYERLTRFPGGLLVMGDAVCGFNPVYGQGMSVAALEAMALRRHLAGDGSPQPRRFLADIAQVITAPWEISTGGDLDFPATTASWPPPRGRCPARTSPWR